jgi:glycogen(starch) synthase
MKILHLSSVYAPHMVGGAERVVETLAEGAARAGHEVSVAHIAPEPSDAVMRGDVQVHPLRHRNPLWIQDSARYPGPVRNLNKIATLFNVLTAHDLAGVIDDLRPDIVHSHSMVELTPLMWRVAKSRGAKLVHTLHDYDLLCIRSSLFKGDKACVNLHAPCAAFSRVKRLFHTHIDHVVGVSQGILDVHLKRDLFKHLPSERRHVIWNPVQSGAPADRERRGVGAVLTFGFMGRLVPEKGIGVLLDACRRLGDPAGAWQLKIAGKAPGDDRDLRAQAQGLPIEFLGFVNPAEFLRDIDVLIVPAVWQEPFGLTIVEAYAAGVPVIGANSGGVAEIIGSVDSSSLVPAGDADALAQKMSTMIAAGADHVSLPDCSEVLARTQPSHVVEGYLNVYRQAQG